MGVATYAALAAVTVFSTAVMLVELVRRRNPQALSAEKTGVLAVLMFLVIGNLDGFRQVVSRVRNGLPLSEFDWWDPSRVNKNSAGFEVTEFPSFTVLFADLHPHFMAMPFFGLGLAGAIAFIERARQGRLASTWVLAIGLGAGTGFIRMVHTWDLPTFIIFVAGAIIMGWIMARGPAKWRTQYAVGQLVAAGAAHFIITIPYRARNQVADSGFSRSESVTNLDDFVAHWGLFLFIAAAFIGSQLYRRREDLSESSAVTAVAGIVGVIGFGGLMVAVGSVAAWSFVGLVAAGLLLITELRSADKGTAGVFLAAAFALSFAVLVGVESFTQNADIARLNTVFKFWLQVWHLFAVAGAVAVSWMVGPLWAKATAKAGEPSSEFAVAPSTHSGLRRAFTGGLVFLILASLVYPALAIKPRTDNRFDAELAASLDGDLWLQPGLHTVGVRDVNGVDHVVDPGLDRPIIDWLQANAQGRPTVVEAVGGSEYQWWGRISINAGLPAVVGWRWHQSQQRTLFDFEVNERKDDVAEFYTTESPEVIDSFLRAYDVTYVVVGSLEQAAANPRTLELLGQNPSLRQVFGTPDFGIYEVIKADLAYQSAW